MVLRGRWVVLATALVVLAASAGLALADDDDGDSGPPRTDPVRARVLLTESTAKARTCQGQDGLYAEVLSDVKGRSNGDPRLSGAVEAKVRDFFNVNTRYGTLRAELVIRDARTGREKVEAKATGVDYPVGGDDETAGFIRGEANGVPARNLPGGELFANFRLAFTEDGALVQVGGAWTNNLIPAVIQRGRCTGPFEPVPPAASTLASDAVSRWDVAR
jgi:hypothetical protein